MAVEVGVREILGPIQYDSKSEFQLVEGTDGGLYRMDAVNKSLFKIAPKGDWELASEEVLESSGVMPNQEGVSDLTGRVVLLSEGYPSDYLSRRLVSGSIKNEVKLTEHDADAQSGIDAPYGTILEDSLLPTDDSAETLRSYMHDSMDVLDKELG